MGGKSIWPSPNIRCSCTPDAHVLQVNVHQPDAQRRISGAMGVSPWQCRWPTSSVSRRPGGVDLREQLLVAAIVSMSIPGSGSNPIVTCLRRGIRQHLLQPFDQPGHGRGRGHASAEHARPERNAIAPQGRGAIDGIA